MAEDVRGDGNGCAVRRRRMQNGAAAQGRPFCKKASRKTCQTAAAEECQKPRRPGIRLLLQQRVHFHYLLLVFCGNV